MKILIAPNAFKNSLSAEDAADAIKRGFVESGLPHKCIVFPVGDGGDGTGKLLGKCFHAEEILVPVMDPLQREIHARWWYDRNNNRAVIEMADASGIRLLTAKERNPMRATSYGTGQLIVDALSRKCRHIILCIGGSATVDGGAALLQALGARYQTSEGMVSEAIAPREISRLVTADFTAVRERFEGCRFDILCDVRNPLLGDFGAVRTFGPQKGASEAELSELEMMMEKWCELLRVCAGRDVGNVIHGGAAGGVSAALNAVVGARLVNGIGYFLDATSFDAAVRDCDVVITGEGRIDDQTMEGKGPFGVALAAKKHGKKVVGLAGSAPEPSGEMRRYFDAIIQITPEGTDLDVAIVSTRDNLIRCSRVLAMTLQASTI
jgi:glycerate kinase